MKYAVTPTHISLIRAGDTVEIGGKLRTVGREDLKPDTFMGVTLFGDSYRGGTVLVCKADIFQATAAQKGQ